MKKLAFFTLCLAVVLCSGVAFAQPACSNLNEPGSMLVFPLIDNVNYKTIIEIANRSNVDVWLQCYMISELPTHTKKDFYMHITQKEPFWWATYNPYNRTDVSGQTTQIQSFAGHKGFMFCWAIDSEKTQLEIDFDYLKGDAVLYGAGRGLQYNAIPQQGLAVVGDRILNLDGVEYTAGPSQIMFEGFAEDWSGMRGVLAVANLDIDFILSLQPPFDINVECWNQNEIPFTRHLSFKDSFQQYDLTDDLQLSLAEVFTPKFQCATVTNRPLWAVFHEYTGNIGFATNVHQHPNTCVATRVVLAPVPQGN